MKNLSKFKIAVKTREYLVQAIYQMLFNKQNVSVIIKQFKNEFIPIYFIKNDLPDVHSVNQLAQSSNMIS